MSRYSHSNHSLLPGTVGLGTAFVPVAKSVREIDPLLLDAASSFCLSRWTTTRRIIVPSVVPSLLLGTRVALPLTIIVSLLVETLTSLPGIGGIMMQSSEVYALLVLVGLFGLLVNEASPDGEHNSAALASTNNRR